MVNPQLINRLKQIILANYIFLCREEVIIMERWVQINVDGTLIGYEVSNHGNVRDMFSREPRPQYERGKKGYQKYLSVSLPINGRYRNCSIHRLVATAFIPNPDNLPQVNHKDTDKQNNYDWNLEWNSQKENINHAIKTGVMKVPGKGIHGRNTKNSEEDVHKVCKLLQRSVPLKKIVKRTGVTNAFIIGIKYGNNWEEIRSQYNIPSSNPYGDRTNDQINMINTLLYNGYRDKRLILKSVGLPDTKTHRRYIKYRLYQLSQMVECSTTIETPIECLPGIIFQYIPEHGMVGLVEYPHKLMVGQFKTCKGLR